MKQKQARWELWWEQTPGPRQTMNQICTALLGTGTVWIQGHPSWPEEFHRLIRSTLSETDTAVNLESITAEENCCPEEVIFSLIPEKRLEYLPAMKLWEFLRNRELLTYTILWVSGLDNPAIAAPWLELSRELARKKAGFRVVCEGDACGGISKNVLSIGLSKTISEFDLLLFAMMNFPESTENTEFKVYLCRLACGAAGDNPERIAALVSNPTALSQDPEGYIAALIPECEEGQKNYAIWRAQIQTAYPAIEQLQQFLIQDCAVPLQAILPRTDDWGKIIQNLDDIELRHLIYWKNQGELILSPESRRILELLYKIRNQLSHRQTATVEDLCQLFDNLNKYALL